MWFPLKTRLNVDMIADLLTIGTKKNRIKEQNKKYKQHVSEDKV